MAISNAQLALKINELLEFFDGREEELQDWMTGAVGGGVGLDGEFPLTDRTGVTVYHKSPAQLEDDVSNLVTGAAGHKTGAESAETGAVAAQAAAEAARDLASGYKDTALGAVTSTGSDVTAAANSATNSNASMVLAEKWAEELEDVEVETSKYSALHHAAKAEAWAGAALTNAASGILGTTAGSFLRWDGAAWVEQTNFLSDANGQLIDQVDPIDEFSYLRQWNPTTGGFGIAMRTGTVANGMSAISRLNNTGGAIGDFLQFVHSDGSVNVPGGLAVTGLTTVPWDQGIDFNAGSGVIKAAGAGGNTVGIYAGHSTAATLKLFTDLGVEQIAFNYNNAQFSFPTGGATTGTARNGLVLVDTAGTTVGADAKAGIEARNSDGDGMGWLTWYNDSMYLRVGVDTQDANGVGQDGSIIRLDGWTGTVIEQLAVFTVGGSYQFRHDGAIHMESGAANTLKLNGKEAFDANDAYLRLNQNSDFASGVYTPGMLRADGGFRTDGSGYSVKTAGGAGIRDNTGTYGTVETFGSGGGGYEGYSINGRLVFMENGSNTGGIYDDVNNKWIVQFIMNADSYIGLYRNGTRVAYSHANGLLRDSQGSFVHHGSSSHTSGKITVSASAASGGANGDIWLKV